jgi:predicted metal-dependent hydrolase
MTTNPTVLKPFNPQQISPRRIAFQFDSQIPRLWFRNSSIMTQLLNGINLALPAFEGYMIRTIQRQLRHLHDPVLRSQAKGLIGQEYNHSQAHQQYNEILRDQNYRFETYLAFVNGFLERLMPRLGVPLQLAMIAGFEHLTTSLSEVILHHSVMAQAHPVMKALWEWHAAEELEHKNIAFDLFQAIEGSYWRRVLGGVLGIAIVASFMTTGMLLLAAQDPGFLSFKTLSDLNKLLLTEYRLIPRTVRHLVPYFQPKFHPSQRDDHHYGEQIFTPSAIAHH